MPQMAQFNISTFVVGTGGVLDGRGSYDFVCKMHGFKLLTNVGGAWNIWIMLFVAKPILRQLLPVVWSEFWVVFECCPGLQPLLAVGVLANEALSDV